jgi:hypothetical protein
MVLTAWLYVRGLLVGLAFCIGLTATGPTGGEQVVFPGWNLGYTPPDGWYVRQTVRRVHVLGSEAEQGTIFLAPGLYESADDVLVSMKSFSRLARINARLTQGPNDTTFAGLPAVLASFSGEGEFGRPIATRLAGVFSPHGTGMLVLGVAPPAGFQQMRRSVEALAATVTAQPPDVKPGAAHDLVGLWLRYRDGQPPGPDPERDETRSIEDTIEFEEGGTYVWKSSVYLAAEARGRADDPTTTAGESDRGVYRVIGDVLVLKGQAGQRVYDLSLSGDRLSLDGATYYRR